MASIILGINWIYNQIQPVSYKRLMTEISIQLNLQWTPVLG